ncbi:unnamed protein product [Adineta ricciae]|uniref:Uncharacterized protein n=1 Tax=Adineta ricciae TaxID=249248 RepID=A0A815C2Z0_ADIRI|nr:unnamed protein product [Adineta ricciae]CAF1281423.1 unnamed protein product [Adineta ricciae]
MSDINNALLDLFSDGDFSNAFDDISFNSNQAPEIDNILPDCFSPFQFDDINTEIEIGNGTAELNQVEIDDFENILQIIENDPFAEDWDANQPLAIAHNPPVPRQAYGNESGIMYQIHPTLLGFITGNVSISQQPKGNNRSRYACDGRRYLPDSRYHPMTVKLPDLRSIVLEQNQTLGIVMTIATDANNPMNQSMVHSHDIMCHENGVEKIGHGCLFIPLVHADIDASQKRFPHVSILYKKYEEYTFNLIPFDANTMFGPQENYTVPNEPNMDNVPRGKRFKAEYNLSVYKFVFHLAMKQDQVVYITNNTCETNLIDETIIPTKPKKRLASDSVASVSSDDEVSSNSQISNSPKRLRSSTSGLPVLKLVTRVHSSSITSDTDSNNAPS